MIYKTILITGSAKRIGADLARGLHTRGHNIIIHYNQSEHEARELASELNNIHHESVMAIQADLINIESCEELIYKAYEFKQQLDVIINNAAVFYPTPVAELDEITWNKMLHVNLRAPLFLAKIASKYLTDSSGSIINITDIHGDRPLKNYLAYSVSKAGLVMLTKSLAKEMGPSIRVNGISPGAIVWPVKMPDKEKQEILAKTVFGRSGEGKDILDAVVYLIENNEYMTGQIMTIDGGRTLYS